jgi:superfamily I DNA/RNA helicase/RecB family exonuclease
MAAVTTTPALRLVRVPRAGVAAPRLDAAQQAVVDHPGGPLLVLAGPGTGKTTTLVESVVARIDAGVDPERILVLTFGRRAAAELRERVTARLARTVREPLARTFHSYAFGVLRREAALRGDPPPRLLSGPEQDLVIRELLRGDTDGLGGPGTGGWPPGLRAALLTRGFAAELRDLLLRCHERGIGPRELDRLGRRLGREDWRAAARFFRQYAAVSALAEPAAYDPAELIRAVVDRMADRMADSGEDLRERERSAYDWVYVDEYQDTDPAQEQLLRHLVAPGGNLVVVGDPRQSIYAFRGADVGGIRRFPAAFPTAEGGPAPQVHLRTCRRSAAEVVAAGSAVARRLRSSRPQAELLPLPGRAPGSVDVLVAASQSQEAAFVAGTLRRAHVVDGLPWSRMAVLVRSTRGRLAPLRRALLAAGVPVGVAGEDLPLADQPGVRPLLDVLRVGARPESLDEETALRLLGGPLAGMDAVGVRRLRRELRSVEVAAGGTRRSGALLVAALADPRELVTLPAGVGVPATRVADLLAAAREAVQAAGATAETVLWAVWERSGLGPRWQHLSLQGGVRGATADRDLDAVMALFEAAARFVDRLPSAGPEVFLAHVAGQQIPGDTLAARAPQGEVVRVLTAHAAKGLEWDLVVVAGVQDGGWPDLRVRGSLLGSEDLVDVLATGGAPGRSAVTALLEEERRLFYVAVTRARERLVVTAAQDAEEGQQPSRFLADIPLPADDAAPVLAFAAAGTATPEEDTTLGELRRAQPVPVVLARLREIRADARQPPGTRARAAALQRSLRALTRSLDLAALVAELREVLTDAGADPSLRAAAAGQLARLADAGVAAADPDEWYAARPLSDGRPLREPGDRGAVRLSPSRVEQFATCELRWLLESVGGSGRDTASQTVGTLVHALAAATADPGLRSPEVLLAELDRRWAQVDLGSPWFTAQQRGRAADMLERFLGWLAGNPRTLAAAEVDFSLDLDAPVEGGTVQVRVAGRVDRLERAPDGSGVVVDLKTGSSKPKPPDLAEHPQLGVYQWAVERGAFPEATVRGSGGASLVQLGKAAGAGAKEQAQPALRDAEDPDWAARLVSRAAAGMAGAAFHARENGYCERCPVRSSCPLQEEGRQVVDQ